MKPVAVEAAADWRGFGAVLAAVFAVAAAAMLAQHASMDAMAGVPMHGGWTMSAAWLRPCGSRTGDAFAAFSGMWGAMVVTMMLPVLAPALWRYRRRLGASVPGGMRASAYVAAMAAGYFSAWMAVGMLLFPLGDALMAAAARLPALARAVPFAAGATVLGAGALQFSGWKARRLACCRHAAAGGDVPRAGAGAAWRFGIRTARDCGACCGNLMAVALAAGIMDLRAMVAVTVAIAAERLMPAGRQIARIVGGIAIGAGVAMLARAAGVV
ncbi:DUF2182 domain-containing protein [Burkholderia pseudomultivorans]|uniref:DUF2182 domain-containing protein n=1 Tax=Burkholderia pseudomultivorans TaxID=1207504 RepID=UPI0007544FE3|nr:DUF2182 domain-containing protein [Burkholderia pseudomultivorans]KVG63590.1 hypothetical protein WS80_20295 [Burkholderia pseudomultivorans]